MGNCKVFWLDYTSPWGEFHMCYRKKSVLKSIPPCHPESRYFMPSVNKALVLANRRAAVIDAI